MLEIRSFRDLLRLFFIFRREFQLAVIATVVVAVLGAFLLPTKYESTARMLVKPGRYSATMPIEVTDRQALVAPSTQRDPIVDEEKLLTGRPVVYQVAERYLALMADYRPQGFWKTIKHHVGAALNSVIEALRSVLQVLGLVEEQTPEERLAKKLEKNFSVGHEPGSAVMEVSFTWNDPYIAQQVVKTWIDAYLEERTRALGRNSLNAFYEGERDKVGEQIDAIKLALRERLQKVNGISVKERLENLTNQINRLSDARAEKINEQAGIATFLADARQQLRRQPDERVTSREISLNPNQLDLHRRLHALEEQRSSLLRTFMPDAPPVREVEESIAQLQARITQEAERIERSQNLEPNSIAVNLRQQIVDAELRERQLAGQVTDYDRQLAALRAERLRVLSNEPEINRLLLELDNAEKSFSLYGENLEKARIDQALDHSQISNIALLEEATLNPSRVFPKSLLILALALPLGLAVGLLTLYLCFLLDQRIHDGARFEEVFKVPLWTTLQHLGPRPWKIVGAFTASIYRLYSHLPLERIEREGLTLALTSARPGEGVRFVSEHLGQLLVERGHQVRFGGSEPASPGEVVLLNASSLMSNQEAFLSMRRADLIALVVEAKTSTIPVVQNALSVLNTAFGKIDGIILNKRRFEVPARLLNLLAGTSQQPGPAPAAPTYQATSQPPQPSVVAQPAAPVAEPAVVAAEAPALVAVPEPVAAPQAAAAEAPAAPVTAPGSALPPVVSTTAGLVARPPTRPQNVPVLARPLAVEPAALADGTRHVQAWGNNRVVEQTPCHSVLMVELKPGAVIPAHFHAHRSKHLLMLSGVLHVEIDGQVQRLREGDGIDIALEQVHALSNPGVSPAQFFEVRLGEFLGEEDCVFVQ